MIWDIYHWDEIGRGKPVVFLLCQDMFLQYVFRTKVQATTDDNDDIMQAENVIFLAIDFI